MKKLKVLFVLSSFLLVSCSGPATQEPTPEKTNPEDFEVLPNTLEDIGGDKPLVDPSKDDVTEPNPDQNEFSITFINADGTTLTTTRVGRGVTPSYTGTEPTLRQTSNYKFTFTGWSPALAPAYSDQTYVAQYSEEYIYKASIYDGDYFVGSIDYVEGETPTSEDLEELYYEKLPTEKYTYSNPTFNSVEDPIEKDTDYQLSFTEDLRTYTVTFKEYSYSSDDITSIEVPYGSMPTVDTSLIPVHEGQVFDRFVDDYNNPVSPVTEDVNYHAVYKDLYTVTLQDLENEKSYTFEVPDGETFTFPHLLDRSVYYTSDTSYYPYSEYDEVTVTRDVTYTINPVEEGSSYVNYVTALDENNNVVLKEVSNLNTSTVSSEGFYLPKFVLDETDGTLKDITVYGDGTNNVFTDENISTYLTYIHLPNTVTTVKSNAFTNLTDLESTIIPTNVTTLETESFVAPTVSNPTQFAFFLENDADSTGYATDWLKNSTPTSITDTFNYSLERTVSGRDSYGYTYQITYGIKRNNKLEVLDVTSSYSNLREVEIPEEIQIGYETYVFDELADNVFDNSNGEFNYLQTVTLPDTITTIGESTFSECEDLTRVNIPSGVTAIKDRTFYDCINLRSLALPIGLKSIGNYAFYNTALTGSYETYYLNGTEEYYSNILRLPPFLETIGNNAFRLTNIETLLVSKYVTSIGSNAFTNITNLNLLMEQEGPTNTISASIVSTNYQDITWNVRETTGLYSERNE